MTTACPYCENHRPVQHRDGREPWCNRCGLNADGREPTGRFFGKPLSPASAPTPGSAAPADSPRPFEPGELNLRAEVTALANRMASEARDTNSKPLEQWAQRLRELLDLSEHQHVWEADLGTLWAPKVFYGCWCGETKWVKR